MTSTNSLTDSDPATGVVLDLDEGQLRARRSVKWGAVAADVIPAWVAEMDFALEPAIAAAIHAAVTKGEVGYGAPRDAALAAATAAFVERRHGWGVDPARVLVTADVMAAIALALRTVCAPGAVIVPTPAYPPFLDVVPLMGRELVTVALDPDAEAASLDLDAIRAALAAGASTLLLCNPHNPWGRAFTAAELGALRDVVDDFGARVISDEVHAPLVLGGRRHVPYASLEGAAEHTTTVVSASKGWHVPGLKCAQIIAGTIAEADRLRRVPLVANSGGSPIGVAANVAAYQAGDQWIDAVCARIETNRDVFAATLAEAAPRARLRRLEATYLQWVDARAYGTPNPAAAALAHGRVQVNDGATFGPGGDRHVRVNLATSTARVREIAFRLGEAWEGTDS